MSDKNMNTVNTMNLDNLKDLTFMLYEPGSIKQPFTGEDIKIIFADDTASGRPCRFVDEYIIKNVYPYYSNTHSNSTCGIMINELVNKTRSIIRHLFNLEDRHKIIFSGNGCTGAVNHLVNKIDYTKHHKVVVHTTPFEHHSNFLPWIEKMNDINSIDCKNKTRVEMRTVKSDEMFGLYIDSYIEHLDDELSMCDCKDTRLDIFTLTACSNVTGKRYDLSYNKLWDYIKQKRIQGHSIYLLLDCACITPYYDVDLRTCDGIFFSGHKLLGGQCTPGVLIVDESLLEIEHPYEPGGGCVEKADTDSVVYKSEHEAREMGGTPNIVGIIRLGYSMMIKRSIDDVIKHNERILSKYVTEKIKQFRDRYPNFIPIGIDYRADDDVPIYPITIEGLHYNLVTVLMNDLFGVQTRGGISCCGTLGKICKDRLSVNGWCRITFSYLHTKKEIDIVLSALEYVIINGESYKNLYTYNKEKNLYTLNKSR